MSEQGTDPWEEGQEQRNVLLPCLGLIPGQLNSVLLCTCLFLAQMTATQEFVGGVLQPCETGKAPGASCGGERWRLRHLSTRCPRSQNTC